MSTPTTNSKEFSLDQLNNFLSMDINHIPDLPELGDLPGGNYRFVIKKAETRNFGRDGEPTLMGIGITLEVLRCFSIDTHESSDQLTEEEKEVERNAQIGGMIFRRYAGEKGMSLFKKELGQVMVSMGETKLTSFLEKAEGLEIDAMISARPDKTKTRQDGSPKIWVNIEVADLAA